MNVTDSDKEQITNTINVLLSALDLQGVVVDEHDKAFMTTECMLHHIKHINSFGITQKRIDAYKIISWSGYVLALRLKHDAAVCRIVIHEILEVLNFFLNVETGQRGLSVGTIDYLKLFVCNEINGCPSHGIGMNGLFVAFHCSTKVGERAQRRSRLGWG